MIKLARASHHWLFQGCPARESLSQPDQQHHAPVQRYVTATRRNNGVKELFPWASNENVGGVYRPNAGIV